MEGTSREINEIRRELILSAEVLGNTYSDHWSDQLLQIFSVITELLTSIFKREMLISELHNETECKFDWIWLGRSICNYVQIKFTHISFMADSDTRRLQTDNAFFQGSHLINTFTIFYRARYWRIDPHKNKLIELSIYCTVNCAFGARWLASSVSVKVVDILGYILKQLFTSVSVNCGGYLPRCFACQQISSTIYLHINEYIANKWCYKLPAGILP